MKRLLLMFFMTLCGMSSMASPFDSVTHIWVGMHGGAGLGFYRDEGVSPLLYRGLEIHPALTLVVRQPRWHFEAAASLDGGAYGLTLSPAGLHAFGGQLTAAFLAMRRVYAAKCWKLWAGAGIDNLFDLRYNPQFGNSSVGIADFARLSLAIRAEAQLPGWLAWAQMGFTPLALLYRPGFSYISNYDRDAANPVECTFDQYQLYLAAAIGISTQLGCSRQLPGGNEIGLSYRWHHITSRTSSDALAAPHRFDQSSHALMIHLMFNIK